jgi:phospholipid transport system substrate-binding protein
MKQSRGPLILMRSRRHVLFALAVALASFSLPGSASAQNGSASQFIRQLAEQALQVMRSPQMPLDAREAQFRGLLAQGFDLDFISRFVLGRNWQSATTEQRTTYQQLYSEYVLRVYSSRFGGYAGETFSVVSERAAGQQDVMVQTRIDRPAGGPIQAEWRVRMAGQPKIIDVMVEGVSMAATQRSEFATIVKNSGVEGLINMLDARTNKVTATAAR